MVAAIADGNTTQREVIDWVIEQGQHNSASEQAVLFYLASRAFYRTGNPEGAEVGQVLYAASYVERIQVATGIKGHDSVRRVLDRLQDKAYIQRERRRDAGTHAPNIIYVLWTPDAARLRQALREGSQRLPVALMQRPTAPVTRPRQKADLVLLQGGEATMPTPHGEV